MDEKGCNTQDEDAEKLAQMGYTPELLRNFSVWSLLAVGFSITNSWYGITTAMITGIVSGGPVVIIYGILLIGCVSLCVGISLSELSSAFPNSGGQYFWTRQLAPQKYSRVLSYLTGSLGWAGAVFASASTALGIAQAIVGIYIVIKPWMNFVAYQLINSVAFIFNLYEKGLPVIIWISLASVSVITITVVSVSHPKQQTREVFRNFKNETGWESNVVTFILGLINVNWAFSCLDAATHMAEEIPQPERNVPKALIGTVFIGMASAFFYSVTMFFSTKDIVSVIDTPTGFPAVELYYQALGARGGAVIMGCMVVVTGVGCLIAVHTWQSRLMWSFARDGGFVKSSVLSRIHPTLGVPVNAHIASNGIVAILGCLYLASSTAFNSMVVGTIVFLYLSYSVPIVCMLARGRESVPHGPFWLGKWGQLANYVTLFWTMWTLVFYNFPFRYPARGDSMSKGVLSVTNLK
ncbi:Choline transport protein [Neolecta irregularis DAH-3]|uniref:Choline transport protein n=1 Tax=Neolecta irregularis (strain DAH-3) TaxID=1198029 RepID=A0A1U7LS13_NEOID|nr:Choline transport protein [Neolecta irregularis DAH-3]|eukprot:OLL25434.1 Choline transport protein [Neolecta irregularis DAH-3]